MAKETPVKETTKEEGTTTTPEPKEGFCERNGITAKSVFVDFGKGLGIGIALIAIPAAVAYSVATGVSTSEVVEETTEALSALLR